MSAAKSSPLTTLDVIGVGLSVEMFQNLEIIEELQNESKMKGSILPSTSRAYTTNSNSRERTTQKRSADVLACAAKKFVQNWQIPSITIWPSSGKDSVPEDTLPEDKEAFFTNYLDKLRGAANMSAHQMLCLPARFSENPEDIMELIFRAFDQAPDLPAMLVFVKDGDITRKLVGDKRRQEYWEDGPRRFGSMAETMVALLFARCDRVNTYINPFAGTRATHLHVAGPTKPGFKPSRFLPECWTAEQLDQFYALPTLAVIHRPVRVNYRLDQTGNPSINPARQAGLLSTRRRQMVFKDSFNTVLKMIPGGEPARIFYDTGGPETGSHVIPLSLAVYDSLPDLEFGDRQSAVDISLAIGNTGAASPFTLWALAVLTCHDKQDTCMTVNLRQREEATITMITSGRQSVPTVVEETTVSASATNMLKTAEPVRAIPLGTAIPSGEQCPQAGLWRCFPADDSGDTFHIYAGKIFPQVSIVSPASTMQKFRGEKPQREVVATLWTLVAYK